MTDRKITTNHPNMILLMKQAHHGLLVDFACPADYNIKQKKVENAKILYLKSRGCGM